MSRVQAHYDKNALGEWRRLDRHRLPLEFAVTEELRVLARTICPPHLRADPGRGGGPGRYAIELARSGPIASPCWTSSAECLPACRRQGRWKPASLSMPSFKAIALDLSEIESDGYSTPFSLWAPSITCWRMPSHVQATEEAIRVLKPGGRPLCGLRHETLRYLQTFGRPGSLLVCEIEIRNMLSR